MQPKQKPIMPHTHYATDQVSTTGTTNNDLQHQDTQMSFSKKQEVGQ